MEHIDIPPFYIGQEVIANCDYSWAGITYFKKGDEFTIKWMQRICCHWVVDIGIGPNHWRAFNCDCGKTYPSDNFAFKSTRFSPKLEFTDFISMKGVTEKALELTSAN